MLVTRKHYHIQIISGLSSVTDRECLSSITPQTQSSYLAPIFTERVCRRLFPLSYGREHLAEVGMPVVTLLIGSGLALSDKATVMGCTCTATVIAMRNPCLHHPSHRPQQWGILLIHYKTNSHLANIGGSMGNSYSNYLLPPLQHFIHMCARTHKQAHTPPNIFPNVYLLFLLKKKRQIGNIHLNDGPALDSDSFCPLLIIHPRIFWRCVGRNV